MGQVKLVDIPQAPVPAGAKVSSHVMADGVEIRAAHWPAPARGARGTVVLFHGRTEFIEKYFEVIADLQARGFGVITFDWRGQGLSSRLLTNRAKGFVGCFSDFVSDAREVLQTLLGPDHPHPHVLLAHSMGGNVALRYLEEDPGRFDRVVLSAPMTGLHLGATPTPVVRILAWVMDSLGLGAGLALGQKADIGLTQSFEDNRVTFDEQRFERCRALLTEEPDLGLGGVTWHWLREAMDSVGMVMSPRRVKALSCPILIASASEEAFVDPRSHKRLADLSPQVSLEVFEGARHEILQEKDEFRQRFWTVFDRFTAPDRPIGPGPSS